jgi:hypothetical protein
MVCTLWKAIGLTFEASLETMMTKMIYITTASLCDLHMYPAKARLGPPFWGLESYCLGSIGCGLLRSHPSPGQRGGISLKLAAAAAAAARDSSLHPSRTRSNVSVSGRTMSSGHLPHTVFPYFPRVAMWLYKASLYRMWVRGNPKGAFSVLTPAGKLPTWIYCQSTFEPTNPPAPKKNVV